MCEYCNFHFEENGECWDRTRIVHKTEERFGYTKIVQETMMFMRPGPKDHLRNFNLNCTVTVGDLLDNTIFDTYIPIKFCPFCGRKLTFPDEEVEE